MDERWNVQVHVKSLNTKNFSPFKMNIIDFVILTSVLFVILTNAFELPHDKPTKLYVRPAVRMKKAWVLSYPLSAQQRLWSDLSLRWANSHIVGFVMRRLIRW